MKSIHQIFTASFPLKAMVGLEDEPFLLGFGNFSGAKRLNFWGRSYFWNLDSRAHSNFQQIQAGEGFLP